MKRILWIISCLVIVLLAQVPGAQETAKWNDNQIKELSKKSFYYSKVDGKDQLVLATGEADHSSERIKDTGDDAMVKFKPQTALSVPGSSLILAFLQCPASNASQPEYIVAFFQRDDLNVPLCFSRLRLPTGGDYYDSQSLQLKEAHKAKEGEFFLVVESSDLNGEVWWLAFLYMDINCKAPLLSRYCTRQYQN